MFAYRPKDLVASTSMPKPDPESQNLFAEPTSGTTVLTSEEITTMAQNHRLISDGFDPGSLQATSYDFRIGEKAIVGGSGDSAVFIFEPPPTQNSGKRGSSGSIVTPSKRY